jgi:hypothetical protein
MSEQETVRKAGQILGVRFVRIEQGYAFCQPGCWGFWYWVTFEDVKVAFKVVKYPTRHYFNFWLVETTQHDLPKDQEKEFRQKYPTPL